MKSINILFIATFNLLLFHVVLGQEPGSGYRLDFNGSNGYVNIPNSSDITNITDYTFTGWVKLDIEKNYNPIFQKQSGIASDFEIYGGNGGVTVAHNRNNGGDFTYFYSNTVPINQWFHLAVTYSNGTVNLYVNGEINTTYGGMSDPDNHSYPIDLGRATSYGTNHLNGQLDEVKLWNKVLTQTEIRDWMCKKITSSHPHYSNLVAYYRFDENIGSTLIDAKGNNDGTLINGPTYGLSKAPIGDESNYQYAGSPIVSLSHPDGDNLTINSFTGSPTGAHIYLVNDHPNSLTGTQGVGANNKYFGVFKVGDNSATYTATYDYTGNPHVGTNESNLVLYKRLNNSITTWSDANAILNTTANTLLAAGENTEYILGTTGSVALPIELISFNVFNEMNRKVKLTWSTASETNNDYFTIERSKNGVDWNPIQKTDGAGNSSVKLNYAGIDSDPYDGVSYYRLKQTDFDGEFEYSQIKSVSFRSNSSSRVEVFPNPAHNKITIKANEKELENIKIYNMMGQDVSNLTTQFSKTENSLIIDLSNLTKGLYILETTSTSKKVHKI